jgi:flagellar protein FlgJ
MMRIEPTQVFNLNKNTEDVALKKACQDFEAFFLQEVFKAMDRTIPREPSLSRDIANSFFYQGVAEQAAKKGDVGLSQYLYNSLRKK